jgi:ABC-type lipoprotein export system ATPase subunit
MAIRTSAPPRMVEEVVAPARASIVSAQAVHKTYETGALRVDALRGIDLELRQGEMVAIIGPSGCGKTTLLNCLSGLDSIDAGEISIEGTPLSEMTDRERTDYRARRMGFVFQFYNLMPVLTAVENVELPLLLARVDGADARRKALAALALVGLEQRAQHVPDEPTGDLDSENATEIVELMRRLNVERGLSFLIVTHDIAVGRKTDRIVRMVDGEIRGEELLGVR